ncbi:SpoIIE family protein phosphatase [Candidatus Magnetominusculus xianensis]|uniref:Serine/threonine protein phosphatase n=1 Tax=Candidatus Magnetominusculus xianensis TaxID=1748249 RepID=A0ABR5SBK7_9BACT|nr:SpoIIE family protein phosphatase [Candidatus Magnetominusculus xianensis]KWT76847.1 serine/threonine protein phosphatase [Candidatus Magnetominusculus xianensis]MBF0402647.1 SpoIIE family protein phosphatase [Nitrospirota bacterium]
MLKNRGITFKFIFLLLTGSTLIFALVFKYNYELTRKIILRNAEDNARHIAEIAVNKIEGVLLIVERVNQNSVRFLESIDETKEYINARLRQIVEHNHEIYGATLAYAPHTIDKDLQHYAPYYYRKDDTIVYKLLGGEKDNYLNQDWYQIPMELGKPIWSEPYFDPDAEIFEATYSVPFREDAAGERFIGVSATDVDLNWLHDTVATVKMFKTGYAFLISRNGTIVTHPDKKLIMNESIFSIAETRQDKNLRDIGKAMIRGETGFKQIDGFGLNNGNKPQKLWLFYMPLKSEGWSLGLIVPDDELLADIIAVHKTMSIMPVAGLLILSIFIASISISITRPLRRLAAATKDIARGNLDIEMPHAMNKDEVGELTNSFIYMKTALKEYIRELTEATRAKEQIQSELKIAHDIQMSFLQKLFPPFPDRTELDLFAAIMPAKEVGGDFYDFFFIDDTHLCFIIADVSGKGVPASLFMAMTMTLLKAQTIVGLSPDEIVFNVNGKLAKDNNVNMFVTVFYGILDTETGVVEFANGGHNPPMLYKKTTAELIPLECGGIVVGILEDGITFDKGVITMQSGDFILMYTDGVTEAINEKDEEFGEERLNRLILENHDKPIKEFVELINAELKKFTGEQPQFDDITLMILKYEGFNKQ